MKFSRFTGFIWLFVALATQVCGQTTINLDIRVPDIPGQSGQTWLKKFRLSNPAEIKFTELNLKIEQIIGHFENSGYPFVQVRIDSINGARESVSGILMVDCGERVTIDTLMNRTGFPLSQAVLWRLMNLRPGEPYRETSVNEASERLGQLSYLSQLRPLEVGFHPGKASVYVYPEKSGSNRFDAWAGLSPDLQSAGRLAFTGALTLNLNNIIRQGEKWTFDWHRNQDRSQKLIVSAHVPYLAGLPFGLQGKFDLYRQDTSYINLGWDLGILYHLSNYNLLTLFVRHRESNILNQAESSGELNRQSFTSFLSGLSWEFNNLDNRLNPYRGMDFSLEASTGRKSIPDSLSMLQSEFAAHFSWFQPLSKNLTLAANIQCGYRDSPVTYQNEQYRLGGLGVLRGFDEDVFYADVFAVTSLELRYLIDRTSHLVVLSDLGFLRSGSDKPGVIRKPAGFGIGGQIRTGGGIFRIIFAVGKDSGQALNMKNSKIHLGYIGVF